MNKQPVVKYPCPVRRIRMVWREGKWIVKKAVRVKSMTLPRSESIADESNMEHGCFDIVDNKKKILFRLKAPETNHFISEEFERGGTMKPHILKNVEPKIELLVPEQKGMTSIVYRPPHKAGRNQKKNQNQIISFSDLDKREEK